MKTTITGQTLKSIAILMVAEGCRYSISNGTKVIKQAVVLRTTLRHGFIHP